MTNGRIFFTPTDMSAAKRDSDVSHARAKREGKKIEGVHQFHCGCGGEGCWITLQVEANKPEKTYPKPTYKKRKRNRFITLPSGERKYLFI